MKVLNEGLLSNTISIKRVSLKGYKEKILACVGDELQLHKWLKDDCDLTKGILEAIPILFNKPNARIKKETKCEGNGDSFCLYHLEWEQETSIDRIISLTRRILSLDYHWQMKEKIHQMEAIILEKTKELSETNFKLENANAELKQMQNQLVEAEKRTLEHRITGGFAHEMRNALSGAQLEFKTILNYKNKGKPSAEVLKDTTTSLLKNINQIHEEFGIPRKRIADQLVPELKTIAEIANHLSDTLHGVASDLDRGLAITTQIRDYAKMSELKRGYDKVDVMALLKGYKDRYLADFKSHNITYLVEGPEKVVMSADEIHLNSIFTNLINNARDAVIEQDSESKEIRVFVEEVDEEENKKIRIKVQDNGPGIAEEQLSEIFEPFFSTKPTSGTGLGLGIVKRLVQLYGGEIDVESKVGEETLFIITFPKENDGF